MRKIEQQMIAAVLAGRDWQSANTAVRTEGGNVLVTLHGNTIARCTTGVWEWTLAGWNTPTTRSRINALARAFYLYRVTTKSGATYAMASDGTTFAVGDSEWVTAS